MNKESNGNGWTKWLIATLWSVMILAFMGLTNGVIANEKESRARDIKQDDRLTMLEKCYERIDEKVLSIKDDIFESKQIQQKILNKMERI